MNLPGSGAIEAARRLASGERHCVIPAVGCALTSTVEAGDRNGVAPCLEGVLHKESIEYTLGSGLWIYKVDVRKTSLIMKLEPLSQESR